MIENTSVRTPRWTVSQGDMPILAKSFGRSLMAENKSPKTIDVYMDAVRLLSEYLAQAGMPMDVANVRREHVESFIAALLAKNKPATFSLAAQWLG